MINFVIKYRDPNQPPAVKHQHSSGRPRKTKTKPIFCEWCGLQIPEYEIKTQRKNRKFHKSCAIEANKPSSGMHRVHWKELNGERFINTFDKEFNLKPIEAIK